VNEGKGFTEIVVDFRNASALVGYGSGDGLGVIDKRQGKPKRFKDPLQAMDWAEMVAAEHRQIEQRCFPDRMRPVKICMTPAYRAWVEAEKARLDAESGGQTHDE